MAARILAFNKSPRLELTVFAVCAIKIGITIAILKQKVCNTFPLKVPSQNFFPYNRNINNNNTRRIKCPWSKL